MGNEGDLGEPTCVRKDADGAARLVTGKQILGTYTSFKTSVAMFLHGQGTL